MRGSLVILVLALAGCAATASETTLQPTAVTSPGEQNVTGTWIGDYFNNGVSMRFTMKLAQHEGGNVTGTYENYSFTPPHVTSVSGFLRDGELVLGRMRFTVSGNRMRGTMPAKSGMTLLVDAVRMK